MAASGDDDELTVEVGLEVYNLCRDITEISGGQTLHHAPVQTQIITGGPSPGPLWIDTPIVSSPWLQLVGI